MTTTPSPGSLSNELAPAKDVPVALICVSSASLNCCVRNLALDVATLATSSPIVTLNAARIFGAPAVDPVASARDVIETVSGCNPAAAANSSRITALLCALSFTQSALKSETTMEGVHTCVMDAASCSVTALTGTCANPAIAKRIAERFDEVKPESSAEFPASPSVSVICTSGIAGAVEPGDHRCVPLRAVYSEIGSALVDGRWRLNACSSGAQHAAAVTAVATSAKTSSTSAAGAFAPAVICAATSSAALALTRSTDAVVTTPERSAASAGSAKSASPRCPCCHDRTATVPATVGLKYRSRRSGRSDVNVGFVEGAAAGSVPSSSAAVITADAHRPVIFPALGKAPRRYSPSNGQVARGRHGPPGRPSAFGSARRAFLRRNVRESTAHPGVTLARDAVVARRGPSCPLSTSPRARFFPIKLG